MKRLLNFAVMFATAAALVIPVIGAHAQAKSLEIALAGADQKTLDWFNKTAFPAFQKDNPGVQLSVISTDWGQFDTVTAGWLTTGSGPDIVYLGSEYASTYGKLLADMSALNNWPEIKNFLPSALQTATFDGKLRGLPILMSPRPYYYRADLTKQGFKDFKPPLTFADEVQFVKDNTVAGPNGLIRQGFMDIGSSDFDAQEFIAYIWSSGGELYKADGSSAFDSPQTAEAAQYMYDRNHAMFPTSTTAGLPTFEGTPLGSGLVVSGIFPLWNSPPTTDKLWTNAIVIAPYPAGKNGKPLIQVFTDWLSVPAYSKNQDLAAKFLEFLGSKDNALALSTVAGYTPVRTDAWDVLNKDPVWSQLISLTQKYGRGFSDIRASAELRPLIVQQMNLFLTDQQDWATTSANLKSQYDAILKKDGYIK
ncbi:MAG: ABC transporter substrate-binding protein [Aggregatilineales bacterium]